MAMLAKCDGKDRKGNSIMNYGNEKVTELMVKDNRKGAICAVTRLLRECTFFNKVIFQYECTFFNQVIFRYECTFFNQVISQSFTKCEFVCRKL